MKKTTLSLFRGYRGLKPTDIALEHIVELIRHDADTAEHTRRYREFLSQGQKEAAGHEKSVCPCFAVAVRFGGGKCKEHIREWTHLCMADFDHIPPEQMEECIRRVREDRHTLLAYTTISGTGLRVVAAYDAARDYEPRSEQELHVLAFGRINHHYEALTGHPYDEKCKNATRLSGVAHDPDVFYNPEATTFLISRPQSGRPPTGSWPASSARRRGCWPTRASPTRNTTTTSTSCAWATC